VRPDLRERLGMGHATDWRKHVSKARPDRSLKGSHFAVGGGGARDPGGTVGKLGFSLGVPRVV
jgi:hypothetical protein